MPIHPAFSHITGQPAALEFLSLALAADRLPHGMIFAGPQGVGRYTTAAALAKIFLADRPNDPESLDAVGKLIDARTHPDFHYITKELIREIEGKSANKAIALSVDVIRDHLVAPATKKSALGRGKVFIVEEAELMNAQAQNAMLKTLEEPSGRTLIILLSDQPHALLSTIRSRTQTVRFQPLSDADALTVVTRNGVDASQAQRAITLAGGSPGLAIRWIEDGVAMTAIGLIRLLDDADPLRGASDLSSFFKTASEEYAKKQMERDPRGSEDGFKRTGFTVYLRIASDHLRKKLQTSESFGTLDNLCDQIDSIRKAEAFIDGNVNTSLVLQQIGAELSA
jgi:DNA polymerase-3 subunit delta'